MFHHDYQSKIMLYDCKTMAHDTTRHIIIWNPRKKCGLQHRSTSACQCRKFFTVIQNLLYSIRLSWQLHQQQLSILLLLSTKQIADGFELSVILLCSWFHLIKTLDILWCQLMSIRRVQTTQNHLQFVFTTIWPVKVGKASSFTKNYRIGKDCVTSRDMLS